MPVYNIENGNALYTQCIKIMIYYTIGYSEHWKKM